MVAYILARQDGRDLVFRVASEDKPVSPEYRLENQAEYIQGNPYMVYGKIASEWLGYDRYLYEYVIMCPP